MTVLTLLLLKLTLLISILMQSWKVLTGSTGLVSLRLSLTKAAGLTRLACEATKRHGVTVSVDLNFRKKLWTKEKAQSIMKPLMQFVDVCIGNEDAYRTLFGASSRMRR